MHVRFVMHHLKSRKIEFDLGDNGELVVWCPGSKLSEDDTRMIQTLAPEIMQELRKRQPSFLAFREPEKKRMRRHG